MFEAALLVVGTVLGAGGYHLLVRAYLAQLAHDNGEGMLP